MKRIVYLAIISLLLYACLSEKNVNPGKPSTFIRYFNGGNNDLAQDAQETSDGGIVILGTTKINSANAKDSSKIKVIRTDGYGETLFQKVYPATFNSLQNLSAGSLVQLPAGGFVITGTQIDGAARSLFVMELNNDLDSVRRVKIDFTSFGITESVQGRAIQLNAEGNYLVLGAIQADTYNMLLAEIDKTDLHVKWAKKYGAGTSSLDDKIFLDNASNIFWSGTVVRNSSDIRLVKTAPNSLNTIFDLPIGKPDFKEEGKDICKFGVGFALVGNTNETANGNQDILFKIVTENGAELFSKVISGHGDVTYGEADTGNSVCQTSGGMVILGTLRTAGQDDYFLMKYDAFGNEVWPEPHIFGNKNTNDHGVSVRQLSGGSLLILGTTVFGGLNTMMLMKADVNGNIQ